MRNCRARILKYVVVLLVVAASISCQPAGHMWVIAGSHADKLTFGISEDRDGNTLVRVQEIRVYRCSDIYDRGSEGHYPPLSQAVWYASAPPDDGPQTNRIVYGDTAAGLKSHLGPQPLDVPGCYVVQAYAVDSHGHTRSSTVGFNVGNNETIAEMSHAEYQKVFSRQR